MKRKENVTKKTGKKYKKKLAKSKEGIIWFTMKRKDVTKKLK